jgi:hypothetical protein
MNDSKHQDDKPGSGLLGLASIGLCFVGIGSALGAIAAVIDKGDFVGAGFCATASALSFGLMLNAILRA